MEVSWRPRCPSFRHVDVLTVQADTLLALLFFRDLYRSLLQRRNWPRQIRRVPWFRVVGYWVPCPGERYSHHLLLCGKRRTDNGLLYLILLFPLPQDADQKKDIQRHHKRKHIGKKNSSSPGMQLFVGQITWKEEETTEQNDNQKE